MCIIDQNKFFSLQKESAKSKAGLPILATNQQSTGFASFCSLKCSWRGKGGAGALKESHNNNFMIIITNKIKILIICIAVVIFTMKIASIM